MTDSKILIILGMHRSGTSLTANWLNQCGLSFGDNIMGVNTGNDRGHYEQLDIYNLHRDILKYNRLSYEVTSYDEIKITTKHKQRAENIFKKLNSSQNQWGWKEPRTCLFINLWHSIIPNAKFFVVFRSFSEVIDSLIRRRIKVEKKRKNFVLGYYHTLTAKKFLNATYVNHLLQVWIKYNSDILKFIKESKVDNLIVVEAKDIINNDEQILKILTDDFTLNLNECAIEKIYEQKLFNEKKLSFDFAPELYENAELIYQELLTLRNKCLNK